MPITRSQVLSIRRIVAGTLILICVGINVLGFLYVSREHKLIEETVAGMTAEHGQAWAVLCVERLVADDKVGLQSAVDAIGKGRLVRRTAVFDVEGRILAATDRGSIGTIVPRSHWEESRLEYSVQELHPTPRGFFHESGHDFEFSFPLQDSEKFLGKLVVTINTAHGNMQAKSLAVRGLWTLVVVTLGIVWAAWALDRRLSGAVKRLIGVTQAIARGQLAQRVRVGTGDELDVLGESVNRMAEALRESEQRVQHWQQQLEATIAQRDEELEQSQALLTQREKMAAMGLMAAGVAHEVGNPLAAISTMLQRIEFEAQPRLQKKCKAMRQQIERIQRILEEMRQFARPVASDTGPININEALRQSLQVCRYDPRAKRVEVVTELDPDVSSVQGDADRWQQVFMNLIFNAFDVMPDGGRLTVKSGSTDGGVGLSFRDTGPGMRAEQIRNLFHPFYTTKQPGRGLGLGLSVCAGIVRSFGGEIQVKSEPGRGTEFRILVPAGIREAKNCVDGAAPDVSEASSLRALGIEGAQTPHREA